MSKTLNPKAMVEFKNLREVKISPDGQKIVYVLQEYDLDQDRAKTSLWIIRRDRGNAVFRLTNGSNDANPAWSPDSQRVAFISGREKRSQLYLINIDGGEAEQIKTEVFPASAPQWSPDGKQLAFLAPVEVKVDAPRYPSEPEELLPKSQKKLDTKDDNARKTEPPRVITDFNYRADGTGFIYQSYRQLHLLTLADQQCVQLTDQHERITDFSWHPSGRSLVYTVQQFELERVRYSTTLRELDIETKSSTKLLDFDGQVGTPSCSPDGQWLLFTGGANDVPYGTAVANIWAVPLRGASLPLHSSKVQCISNGLNRSCRQLRWTRDGAWIYFLKEDAGSNQLYKMPVVDGAFGLIESVKLNGLATVAGFDLATDLSIAYIADDFVTPPQVYVEHQGRSTQLTELNRDYLRDCEFCSADKMHYKGPDEWDVEGWVVKPRGYEPGRRYPTILSVHGGPTGVYMDSFNLSFQILAHQGYAVVFTNPRGSTSYGTEFTQGVVKDWGGKDYADIMAGLDKAIELGSVDENRVGIMGWSYGGYMTCWTVTQTNRFKAAVGGANISNIYTLYGCSDIGAAYDEGLLGGPAFDDEELYMGRSAIRHVRNVTTPILLLHGEADIRCPIDQSEQFYACLKRLGKEVVFVRYPEQYHGFVKPSYIHDRWARTVAWFNHYIR